MTYKMIIAVISQSQMIAIENLEKNGGIESARKTIENIKTIKNNIQTNPNFYL